MNKQLVDNNKIEYTIHSGVEKEIISLKCKLFKYVKMLKYGKVSSC